MFYNQSIITVISGQKEGSGYNISNLTLKNTKKQQLSTHTGVNLHSKYITQVQQQRPESPMVTLTWHVCKYDVQKPPEVYPQNKKLLSDVPIMLKFKVVKIIIKTEC